jgi:hypothetical protein
MLAALSLIPQIARTHRKTRGSGLFPKGTGGIGTGRRRRRIVSLRGLEPGSLRECNKARRAPTSIAARSGVTPRPAVLEVVPQHAVDA